MDRNMVCYNCHQFFKLLAIFFIVIFVLQSLAVIIMFFVCLFC